VTVAFKEVSKVFGDGTVALDRFSLEFESGEFVVLLGPSGSGKTTACRVLAGLEQATSGAIEVDGRDITGLPPRERAMSMVFQNYALYSHKSVYDNIAYPLRVRGVPKDEIDGKVRETSRLLQIGDLIRRRPRQLSGGEAQRVAVARALVWEPDICLMDEPLSNLDAILRLQTRTELKRLHNELRTTFVFVTHDQEEAMTLGTRIAVLNHGRLVQFEAPKEIYHRPVSRFVAEFIGRPAMNTLEGRVEGGVFRTEGFSLAVPGRDEGAVVLGIRPEHIMPHSTAREGAVACRLDVLELVEPDVLLFVDCGGQPLIVRSKADISELESGAELYLELPPARLHFFDAETGLRQP
jgi:ABC-type sugar transport system ATPase subunit